MAAIALATLFIAYANGANDNFKGVATLFGSGTAGYRRALSWATGTTLLGSLGAFFLSGRLLRTFSGKGLLADNIASQPAFLCAVVAGAGLTVFLAARAGIPVSTTHSLTGALAGAGLVAVGRDLAFGALGKIFFLPLLLSPVLAVALTVLSYHVVHRIRLKTGITRKSCLCAAETSYSVPQLSPAEGQAFSLTDARKIEVWVDAESRCDAERSEIHRGRFFGISFQSVINGLHFLSAGAVSFARGLNDTPKIVALAVAAGFERLDWGIAAAALAMAAGALMSARPVAETVSHRITGLNDGQGLTANAVTALLVIGASGWGVPVSTTHVSCGSLFGIGLANGSARWKIIGAISAAWLLTLPMAAALAALSFWMLS